MKQEKQTRENLIKVAKEEFLEKGYMEASLRSICKKAGVTTGALYFFFQDKKELFGSIVDEPLENMYKLMDFHYENERKDIKTKLLNLNNMEDDQEAAKTIVDYLYQYHDEFVLLLTKSHGSIYENCVDGFIDITEKHYRILADNMSELYGMDRIDDYTIHWFSHLQIYSFEQLIVHGLSKEDAVRHMNTIVKFFISGWFGIYKMEHIE
jgi:Transcriptional regulator